VLPLSRYIIPCDGQWLLAYMLHTCWKQLLYWEYLVTSAKLTCFITTMRPGEKAPKLCLQALDPLSSLLVPEQDSHRFEANHTPLIGDELPQTATVSHRGLKQMHERPRASVLRNHCNYPRRSTYPRRNLYGVAMTHRHHMSWKSHSALQSMLQSGCCQDIDYFIRRLAGQHACSHA